MANDMSTNGDAMTTSELLEGSKLKTAGLTDAEIDAFARGMMTFLRSTFVPELVEKQIEPLLRSQMRRLEDRIRAIEERPLLEDVGVWNPNSEYCPGMVCTFDGSSWVCKTWHRNGKPGSTTDWRLLVKRGRDGKDSR